jgi:hypothetical protein
LSQVYYMRHANVLSGTAVAADLGLHGCLCWSTLLVLLAVVGGDVAAVKQQQELAPKLGSCSAGSSSRK